MDLTIFEIDQFAQRVFLLRQAVRTDRNLNIRLSLQFQKRNFNQYVWVMHKLSKHLNKNKGKAITETNFTSNFSQRESYLK